MPKISVVIPTHDRPELLKRAVASVQNQTYKNFELIVIDDVESRGGGWARNQGIKKAQGDFIALLDDDDEWMPNKLEIQMGQFEDTTSDVGFCFSAVKNIKADNEDITQVPEGIHNYHKLALESFKCFLTVTLIIKKSVFEDVGYFDEKFPSHQDAELMVRISGKYKGLGINKPLTLVNMRSDHDSVGKNFEKRIVGREMILDKYMNEFKQRPQFLAHHYFELGLLYRDNGQFKEANKRFILALKTDWKARYFFHRVSMSVGALPYILRRWIKT